MIKHATYDDYNEYIIDYDTSNASFLMMASILRRKGIKNYNFFLKLYDEDLVGVDPYDPDLDPRTKMKIIIECRRNFWYFIREVMIVPGVGRYKLNRGNLALSWCCLNNIPVYEMMPRQHGKTWGVIAYGLWVFNFASEYTSFLFLNKQLTDSQRNLKSLKDARSELPEYLRNDKILTTKGELKDATSNVNTLSNVLHNTIYTKASARNAISADELGRGMTVSWVWIDELAFLQYNRIIYAAMAPAWSKAVEVAKEKGRPIGKIITTTPSDLSNDMGLFAKELIDNSALFDEHLYNMDMDEVNTWIDKNSRNGFIYIEFNYMQLAGQVGHKHPGKWFDEQCKALNFDWPKIRREILLQWNNASSNSPFDPEDLRNLRAMQQDPYEDDSIIINKYYKLNVYKKLEMEKRYIITIDPARGRGEQADRTALTVIDAETEECCAIFKSPTIQYKETFRFLHTLFYTYIPNSVIVIENNIDTLIEYVRNSTMKHALYYEPVKSVIKENKKNKPNNNNIVYGITTTSEIRPKYFDILFEMIHSSKNLICAKELVEEIETLEAKTATRIEAVSSKHDDVIISYLMGIYVRRYGHNRARFSLLYSDGIAIPTVNVPTETFTRNIFINKKYDEDDRHVSTFWTDLADQIKSSTSDIYELDRREEAKWRQNQVNDLNDENESLTYTTNVFTGEKDVSGISQINSSAFYELNTFGRNINEAFGGDRQTSIVDDTDDLLGWF